MTAKAFLGHPFSKPNHMIPVRTSVDIQETPGAVIGLIIANVAVFLVQNGLPPDLAEQFINHNALVPARYTQPELAGELGLDPDNYLPFLTNSFMHAGLLHLILNIWTLWLFGGPLEERLGAPRFILIYLICGMAANLVHFTMNPDSPVPALGASGSIAGLLGGFALLYPRARIAVLTPVLFFPLVLWWPAVAYTAVWFAFQLLPGIATALAPEHTGGIAWWAHIGGFAAGFILIKLLGAQRRRAREIGAARPRMRRVGPERRQVIGTSAPRKGKAMIQAGRRPAMGSRRNRKADGDNFIFRLARRFDESLNNLTSALEDEETSHVRRPGPWG